MPETDQLPDFGTAADLPDFGGNGDLPDFSQPPNFAERVFSSYPEPMQRQIRSITEGHANFAKGIGKELEHFGGTLVEGLAKASTTPSQIEPAPTYPGAGFGVPPARTELLTPPRPPASIPAVEPGSLNKRYLEALTNDDQLYQIGKVASEAGQPTPEEQKDFWFKAGGYVGGAAPMALGPLAPAAFTLSSIGQSVETDYNRIKAENPQIDDNDAADQALTLATEKGAITAGTFYLLPKVLRGPLEKYLVNKLGTTAFKNWLAGRGAAGLEGAALMGTQTAGHQAVEGKTPDEETAKAAAGGFLFNILLPWRRGQEQAKSARPGEQPPPESPTAIPPTKPPAPVGESPTVPAQPTSQRGMVRVSDAFNKALDELSGRTATEPEKPAVSISSTSNEAGKMHVPEKVVAAAVKIGDEITTGTDHADAIYKYADKHKIPVDDVWADTSSWESGFVTDSGRFIELDEAAKMGQKRGQAGGRPLRHAAEIVPAGKLPDFTSRPEPATVTPAAPETITGRTAAGETPGTAEQTGSPPATSGTMPAEEGSGPSRSAASVLKKKSQADQQRPWDLIDEVEGQIGTIDPKLIKEADPNWKPIGAARKIFKKGGQPADKAADSLGQSGMYKGDPGQVDQFGAALNAAGEERKGWRKRFSQEKRILDTEERQATAFGRDANKPGPDKEILVPDDLFPGDEFELHGTKVRVKEFSFDDDGEVSSVTLDDGKKYGTQRVPAGTKLLVDKGSRVTPQVPTVLLPETLKITTTVPETEADLQRQLQSELYETKAPSGFNPPPMPERFDTVQDLLRFRDQYKESEIRFYESLGMSRKEAEKFFRAGDARSNLDVSNIEARLTPENQERLDKFSTGEGAEMYQWDRQYDPSELEHESSASELARHLARNISRESEPTELGDKLIHAALALRKLKEVGGTWQDVAKALDTTTTRQSSSQGDKAEIFKTWGQKIRRFAAKQGVDVPMEPPDHLAGKKARAALAFTEAEQRRKANETAIAEAAKEPLPESESPQPDAIEDFLNKAIEKTKPRTGLETGEVSVGLARLPVWLTQELAHGSLKVVRAAYKGGKALAQAIEDGIQWLRTEAGKAFNEKEARAWLNEAAKEPETTTAADWKAIHTEREALTKELADLNEEIRKAGGRREANTELKDRTDTAIAKHKALTAQLRQQPGYVEDLLNQFNAAKDDMAREDLKGELTMISPDMLNRVYRDMQSRGIIPDSQKLPDPFSTLQGLTDWLKANDIESPKRGFRERLGLARRAADALAKGQDALRNAWARTVAFSKAQYELWKHPPIDDDFRALVKDWNVADEQSGKEAYHWQKVINARVEDPRRRAAIMAWIQAGGFEDNLRQQLAMVPDRFKPIWEAATKLTADEKRLANHIRADWAEKLEMGKNAGLVERGRENYGPTVWSVVPKIAEGDSTFAMAGALETRKGTPGNPNARLDPRNPFFSFHKSYPTFFDGIMAGGVPQTMDVGQLVAYYHQAFNKSLSSRAVVKAMLDAKAKDGRPVVILSGRADPLTTADGETKGYIVDARYKGQEAQTADGRPYESVDHFALKDWKFLLRTENGKPILARADMLVHPDHAQFLKNVLLPSPLRKYAVVRGAIKFNRFLKESKFALSPFHLATLAEHALSHTVNPWTGNFKLDLNDPKQRGLVRGGVDLGFSGERVDFQEGLSSHGGLWSKIPGIGDLSVKFTDFLFKDYLPSIKMKMALEALERNQKRYGSKLTEEQIFDLTASQSNAAFGSQNYRLLGRSPLVRDLLSLSFVAPDFLFSRMKFVGQALKPHGAEQRRALFIMTASLYVGARVLNALVDQDNDPHWGFKDAFSVVYKGRRYSLRTVTNDIWHMITDPRSFWYNRLSPITRTAIELTTHKDWRGVNRNVIEQVQDVASWIVPASMEGLVPGSSKRETGVVESLGRSVGVMSRKDTAITQMREMARDFNRDSEDPDARAFQKSRDQETLPDSAYRDLDMLLEAGDLKGARKEYDRLVREGHKPSVIAARFRNFRPFTGTVERDKAFYNSLSTKERKLYDRARAEHQQQYERFKKIAPGL